MAQRVSLLFCLLAVAPIHAQPFVVQQTLQMDALLSEVCCTFAAGDPDNDGWPDLQLGIGWGNLHNQGLFADRTRVLTTDGEWGASGVLFGDVDNDGDQDLFLPRGFVASHSADVLLMNDRGRWRETVAVADRLPTDNAIWLDYDRDGNLDLYTGHWLSIVALAIDDTDADPPLHNSLYRGHGDGTFTDVTAAAGLDLDLRRNMGSSHGMAAADFDSDGWPDIYVGVWRGANRLFRNDGQGGFVDVTTGDLGDTGRAAGVVVADVDNDGDLDLFQASGGNLASAPLEPWRSYLLVNLGEGRFVDVTESAGLQRLSKQELYQAFLEDLDNDGDVDLLTGDPAFLFANNGTGVFTERTQGSGLGPSVGRLFDADVDGRLDVIGLQNFDLGIADSIAIYRNEADAGHWLRVDLVGVESNRDGIGARLQAISGSLVQTRELLGGTGYGYDESIVHFGLGRHETVERLEVRWPSGQIDAFEQIPADQTIRVFEGQSRFHTVVPTTWESPIPEVLVEGQTADVRLHVRPALYAPDAQVTSVMADLSALGGAARAPLRARGDGTWDAVVAVAPVGTPGARDYSVFIEQSTSLGPQWARLTRTLEIWPGRDLPVFGETSQDWLVDPGRGLTYDPASTLLVHRGATAMQLQPTRSWNVTFVAGQPAVTIGYRSLVFALHTAGASGGSLSLSIEFDVPPGRDSTPNSVVDLLQPVAGRLPVDLRKGDWQVVEIPLGDLARHEPIKSIRLFGDLQGSLYIDDMRLVAEAPRTSTAVTEDYTQTRPTAFALGAFPNPFNPATTIHFDLPQATALELAVYNLAGQRVAMLAHGVRAAGSYAVRWDGRDDAGRSLASGVYLYRLMAGSHTAGGKLLLLR